MGLASWAVVRGLEGLIGVLLGALIGLVVFPVLLLALRGLSADDAAWVRDNAGDRLGGLVGRLAGRFVVDA